MLGESLREFAASGAGQAASAVFAVGFVDFVLQILADLRDDKFKLDSAAEWLRTDLAGKILPIWVLLFVGYYVQGVQFSNIPLLLAAGVGAAAVYVAEVIGNIINTWGPNRRKKNGTDTDRTGSPEDI